MRAPRQQHAVEIREIESHPGLTYTRVEIDGATYTVRCLQEDLTVNPPTRKEVWTSEIGQWSPEQETLPEQENHFSDDSEGGVFWRAIGYLIERSEESEAETRVRLRT